LDNNVWIWSLKPLDKVFGIIILVTFNLWFVWRKFGSNETQWFHSTLEKLKSSNENRDV